MKFLKEKDVELHIRRLLACEIENKKDRCYVFPKLETDVLALPDIMFLKRAGHLCFFEVKFIPEKRNTVSITPLFSRQLVVIKNLIDFGAFGGVITNDDIENKSYLSIDEHLQSSYRNYRFYYEKCYKKIP